jgi:molecular chaperone GrpE
MSQESGDNKKGFTVVDRRFWSEENQAEEADDSPSSPGKPTYVAELEQKLEERERLLRQYIAQHKESVSEFDNAKARIGREVSKDLKRNRREMIVEFLEVVDNLDRAFDAAKEGQDPSAVIQGVSLLRELVLEKLRSFGVRRMQTLGQGFNPSLHEALTVVPVDDPEQDGRIVGVIREGYHFDDEILRPAAVAVARVPAGQ